MCILFRQRGQGHTSLVHTSDWIRGARIGNLVGRVGLGWRGKARTKYSTELSKRRKLVGRLYNCKDGFLLPPRWPDGIQSALPLARTFGFVYWCEGPPPIWSTYTLCGARPARTCWEQTTEMIGDFVTAGNRRSGHPCVLAINDFYLPPSECEVGLRPCVSSETSSPITVVDERCGVATTVVSGLFNFPE
jgi:hypothetical protein